MKTIILQKEEIITAIAEYVRAQGYQVLLDAEVTFYIQPLVDATRQRTDQYTMQAVIDVEG